MAVRYFQFLAIALTLSHVPVASSRASDDPWWKPIYDQGQKLLQEERPEDARKQFETIIKRDKKIAEGHYGLGLVARANKNKEKAFDHFRQAARANDNFAEPYYQMALLYSEQGDLNDARKTLRNAVKRKSDFLDAWLLLANLEAETGSLKDMINAYSSALELAPGNMEIYSSLLSAVILNNSENQVIPLLEGLHKAHPDNRDYLLDLAYMNYAAGNDNKSLELLSTVPLDAATSRYYLLQSKLMFDADKDEEGLAYYWSAVNNIKWESDSNTFYRDLCYIMKNDEYRNFMEAPAADKWRFFYRFWRSRDPDLGTEMNERIPEHYRRLKYARKWYRRTMERGEDRRYRLEHPLIQYFNGKMGDELLDPHVTEALPKDLDLDDLGLIYLRHGKPDLEATYVDAQDETLPQNISWKYNESQGRPEMIFHFAKWGGNRGWMLTSLPVTFQERWELGSLYVQLDPQRPEREGLIESDYARLYDLVQRDNTEYAMRGVTTETSDVGFKDTVPLDFPYQFVTFRAPGGKSRVEFYYGINGKNTDLKYDPEGNLLVLNQLFAFHDEKWNDAGRIQDTRMIRVGVSRESWKDGGIVDVRQFDVTPGTYNLELQMEDAVSGSKGVYRGQVTFGDYNADTLTISDILLSSSIGPAVGGERFVKEDVAYSPHMFTDFKSNEEAGIYFEIYNLKLDEDNQTRFRVTCTLQPRGGYTALASSIVGFFKSLFDKEKEAISTSYDYEGKQENEKIYLNFGLKDQTAGNYELLVTIEDLITGSRTTESVGLAIRG